MALDLVSEHWAYDLSKNVLSKGEIFDQDVINLSIEMILSTYFGERVFNPLFGSQLPYLIFENFSNTKAEQLAEEILRTIELFEDRIVIDRSNSIFTFKDSSNTLEISIPYYVIKEKIKSYFNKRIVF